VEGLEEADSTQA